MAERIDPNIARGLISLLGARGGRGGQMARLAFEAYQAWQGIQEQRQKSGGGSVEPASSKPAPKPEEPVLAELVPEKPPVTPPPPPEEMDTYIKAIAGRGKPPVAEPPMENTAGPEVLPAPSSAPQPTKPTFEQIAQSERSAAYYRHAAPGTKEAVFENIASAARRGRSELSVSTEAGQSLSSHDINKLAAYRQAAQHFGHQVGQWTHSPGTKGTALASMPWQPAAQFGTLSGPPPKPASPQSPAPPVTSPPLATATPESAPVPTVAPSEQSQAMPEDFVAGRVQKIRPIQAPPAEAPVQITPGIPPIRHPDVKPPPPPVTQAPAKADPGAALDATQAALDVAGVVVPGADALNAATSLKRAVDDPENRGTHLMNAALSAVGEIPILGDAVKLGGKGLMKMFGKGGKAAAKVEGKAAAKTAAAAVPPSVVSPSAPSVAPGGTPVLPGAPGAPGGGGGGGGVPPGSGPTPAPGGGAPGGGGWQNAVGSLLQGGMGGGIAGGIAAMNTPRMPDLSGVRHDIRKDIAGPAVTEMAGDAKGILDRNKQTMETILNPFVMPMEKFNVAMENSVKNMIELPSALLHWGEALKDSKRYLEAFNGAIALSGQEEERRRIMRSMESGGRLGTSTLELTRALDDIKDDMQPIKDLIYKGTADIVTVILKVAHATIIATEIILPLIPFWGQLAVLGVKAAKKYLEDDKVTTTMGYDLSNAIKGWDSGPDTRRPGDGSRGRK